MGQRSTGKHIVLTTFGSFGDLHPYVAIALELQSRGHRATIATSEVYRDKVESEGLGFHAVRPDLPELGPPEEVIPRALDVRKGSEYVIREMMMAHLKATYEDIDRILPSADVVVTHTLSFAAHLWIEKHPLPWVSTVLQPTSMFSMYDPPVMAPAPGLSRFRGLGPVLYGPLYRMIRKEVGRWLAPMQKLRAEIGLPPTERDPFFEGQYSPACNLALFSTVLAEPQRDWPANTVVTGFPFYDRLDKGTGMPDELLRFLETGDPPIVFTLGSSAVMDAGDFYTQSVDAARRLEKRAVLLVGRDERNVPSDLPKDVIACRYAPHSELFPRACAIVHQGGIGTMGQALRSGKPELIVPYGQDQPDNAARVVRIGTGRTIPRAKYSAQSAERELGRLLTDGSYAYRASRIGTKVREEDGARTAADAILRIAQ
jgi:UDP:flavonoid glycosyltransferase YjiC (YdhE family)